jgi:hypothetical protein
MKIGEEVIVVCSILTLGYVSKLQKNRWVYDGRVV